MWVHRTIKTLIHNTYTISTQYLHNIYTISTEDCLLSQVQQELDAAKRRLTKLKVELKTRGVLPALPPPDPTYPVISRYRGINFS